MPRPRKPQHAPAPPPRPQPREPWPTARPRLEISAAVNPSPVSMWSLLGEQYHLPPWQRGQVWTPEQQVALCEAVWEGLPVAPFLVWERYNPATKTGGAVVLDGQQRLCAFSARVKRHNGTPCDPTAAHLDLETGRWQVGPAKGHPPVTMANLTDMDWMEQQIWNLPDRRTQSLVSQAAARIGAWTGVVYRIGERVSPEYATEIFRGWNVPGVPIPADEVEALIQQADLGWTP